MFDIGMGEMALLAAIALIAIGPKQLPEVARVVGRFLSDIKRMTTEFSRSMNDVRETATRGFNDAAESTNRLLRDVDPHSKKSAQHGEPDQHGAVVHPVAYPKPETSAQASIGSFSIHAPDLPPAEAIDAKDQMSFELPADPSKPGKDS